MKKKLTESEKEIIKSNSNLSQWHGYLEDVYNKDSEAFSEISFKVADAVKSGFTTYYFEEEQKLIMILAFYGIGCFLKKYIGQDDPDMAYPDDIDPVNDPS